MRGNLFFIAIFCCAAALIGIRAVFVRTTLPDVFVPFIGTHVEFEGIIVAPPDVRETSDHLSIEIRQNGEKTRVIASVPLYPTYTIGDQVKVSGVLALPQPFATDGGRMFAYDKFLAKDGVFALIQKAKVEKERMSPRSDVVFIVWRWLLTLRSLIQHSLQAAIPEPYSSLAIGILIGGKQGLGKELMQVFLMTGLLQMVVLSGYNVSIVANGILLTLKPLPKLLALLLAGVGVVLFVSMAGASSSAIRAGCMSLFALFAKATHRPAAVLRALFFSLFLMLFWNPLLLIYDPGFQLSFLATLGLIVGAPLIEMRMLWVKSGFIRELLATTIAAQTAVLPILLYQSGNLSLVALPANILTMPFVPMAMTLSAGAAFAALLTPSATPFVGLPAFAVLWYLISVAKLMAKIPFAQVIIPTFPFWVVGVAYGALALLGIYAKNHPPARSAGG
jgi:competence protein ComEC